MSIKYNYFKIYKIEPTEGYQDDIIHYIDGDSFQLGYSTSANSGLILGYCGASIPIYCWLEPPSTKKLELVPPGEVIDACNKALKILATEKNPQIDYYNDGNYEPLFDDKDLKRESLEDANKRIVRRIKEIKNLSQEGYYITEERD